MTRTSARQAGFTLLEILVAVAVFAIFSAMAYGGLIQLLDSRARIDAERAYWREIALAFVRLQQDFTLARNRPIRSVGGGIQVQFQGQPTDPRAMADPNVEFTRGGMLVPNGFTADLQRVGYQLREDKLMRLTWPVLDRAPTTQPVSTPLLRDVEEFEVRFFQQSAGSPSANTSGTWIDRWPPLSTQGAQQPGLPRAVEVTVALKGRGKYKRTFLVGADP